MSSEYFRAMLDHDTEENSQGFVIMKDVDASAVRKAVEFIYTGKASVRDDDIAGLIHVAYLMQLDALCEGIGKLLADGISVESFYATKQFADMYKCKGLGNTCKQFAFRNFQEIVFIEEFGGLEEDYILALITSPSTKATEVRKYKAIKKWIDCDELNRRQCFSTMLRAIKVSKFPASFCRYIIENEPMVYKSVKCMQILTRSLFETFKVLSRDVDDDQNAIAAFAPAASSLMAYKVEDESWHEFCEMDATMKGSTFSIINMDDIILALRGDRKVFRLEYHNTGKAKWSKMQPMMYAHGKYPPVVTCRQRAYVIGNSDNGKLASEVMDMTNNVWTEVAVTRHCNRRRYFSLCASDNAILVIGGNLNQNRNTDIGRQVTLAINSSKAIIRGSLPNQCLEPDYVLLPYITKAKYMSSAGLDTSQILGANFGKPQWTSTTLPRTPGPRLWALCH